MADKGATMKRLLIWFVVVGLAGVAWAGPNLEPHYGNTKISLGEAIREGWIKPYSDYCYSGGGIDPRYGGTKQPVGATGIRDMRTDLWGGADGDTAAIVVNAYTDANGYGVYFTRADEYGDSISIYRYAYTAKAGDLRAIGATTCGARDTTWIQVACSNYDYIAPIRHTTAFDPCVSTTTQKCWPFDAPAGSLTTQSADSVVLLDQWYFNGPIAAEDTCQLEIKRRIRLHKDVPYILVRYSVKSVDMDNGANAVTGDTLRFIWTDAMTLGQDGIETAHDQPHYHPQRGLGSQADVGYQNNYGEVRREHHFTSFSDPVGSMLNIGNLLAVETPLDGLPVDSSMTGLIREEAADSCWLDQGSGTAQTLGMFVAFNPNGTVPTEIFYGDQVGSDGSPHMENWAVFAYDSTIIGQHEDAEAFNYDSTQVVLGKAGRGLSFRSDPAYIDTASYTVWEYAIGTVRFSDQSTPYWPAIPKITFTDGTVLAIPYYRKR